MQADAESVRMHQQWADCGYAGESVLCSSVMLVVIGVTMVIMIVLMKVPLSVGSWMELFC